MFLHFLPQLDLRSEEAAHLGRPWIRLCKERTNHFQPDLVYIEIFWCSVSLLFTSFYFRSKLGSFLSDFYQLSTSSWCLDKILHFNLKSPWSLEKDAKSSLLKSSTHIVLPWLYKLRLFITENDKNSERLYSNPRLTKLFFVTRLTKGGGLLQPLPRFFKLNWALEWGSRSPWKALDTPFQKANKSFSTRFGIYIINFQLRVSAWSKFCTSIWNHHEA